MKKATLLLMSTLFIGAILLSSCKGGKHKSKKGTHFMTQVDSQDFKKG